MKPVFLIIVQTILAGITVILKLCYVSVSVDLHFLKVIGAETIVSYTRHAGNF